MNVKRMNTDFGNSINMNLIDGYYFEIPTNVVELSKEKAEGYFVTSIDSPQELLKNLLVSCTIDNEERYFLVGEVAEDQILGNNHIRKLHNKAESHIPYVLFLASNAYYYTIKNEKEEDNKIEIDYFSTMLPIWLLFKLNKFSEMQQKMAQRFLGTHSVKVHTPGFEKEISIEVNESKCRTESEVARWAIKKTFELEDNSDAEQFKNHDVVMVDLGGGSGDLCLLPAGLNAPRSRESMAFIADIPFLGHIEKLRTEKLIEHFDDVRELENFIVKNIGKTKMERRDGNSGKSIDLATPIKAALKDWTSIVLSKIEDAFPSPKDKTYKYCYFGGVAPVVQEAIEEIIKEKYGSDILESNHIFLPEARKLNLYGLEILSRADTLVKP
ncbi:ParM/StbA family protein [Fictibacillus sp. 5RED26]|uniref:ParM/StbA family protein n=1 Tax=Fictibacillus sp. 5RED26 TaxID=2745876 RepID=UPI0018CC8C32|nr:ParM/StbA family protein [Fictibacillus sp. 5RED26]MBH0158673.1 ParM/StbA family protein [Fictibacillus sp. 5RED26]